MKYLYSYLFDNEFNFENLKNQEGNINYTKTIQFFFI